MPQPAPIIVTALFGDEDFAWLDGLRREYFPVERNVVPAHLTLFRHLPPSVTNELKQRLAGETHRVTAPKARASGFVSLGNGVALRIESEELEAMRNRLADAFQALLTPQDRAPWRGHVTVQNKVAPKTAKASQTQLEANFRPRPLVIKGLASWYFRGGPWEPLSRHTYSG